METCEVLIVGGGPAGSSCAWKLRQAGVEVVVVDKKEFPRHKVCAGWVTPPVFEELAIDLADYDEQQTLQPITRFITGMIGGPEIETDYHMPVSYGIRRCEFDNYLLGRSGAQLRLGTSLKTLRRDGAVWILNEELRAPVVIGAGGHFCPVARQFAPTSDSTASEPNQPTVMAQETEFEMTDSQQAECSVLPDRPELYFCPDLKGYGWVFRKGRFINIGLGREGETHLSNHVQTFVDRLVERGKIPRPVNDRFCGHAYRLRKAFARSLDQDGILLIGDSAGLAAPESGEGIRPAIESGLLAAATILESECSNGTSLAAKFAAKLRDRFGKGSDSSILRWVPTPVLLLLAGGLMRSRWFARRVLLDQWFLSASQGPLKVSAPVCS